MGDSVHLWPGNPGYATILKPAIARATKKGGRASKEEVPMRCFTVLLQVADHFEPLVTTLEDARRACGGKDLEEGQCETCAMLRACSSYRAKRVISMKCSTIAWQHAALH